MESRWGGTGTWPTTVVATGCGRHSGVWAWASTPSAVVCSFFAELGADIFITGVMERWAADLHLGGFPSRWGWGEQAKSPADLSGGWKLPGDLVWGQGESTGIWLRSVGTGENWAISSRSTGKALSQGSRKEHQRFNPVTNFSAEIGFLFLRGKMEHLSNMYFWICVQVLINKLFVGFFLFVFLWMDFSWCRWKIL